MMGLNRAYEAIKGHYGAPVDHISTTFKKFGPRGTSGSFPAKTRHLGATVVCARRDDAPEANRAL